MELLNAKWELESGRTIDLRVVEKPGRDHVNPFKKYTKKRGSNQGQIFECCIVDVGTGQVAYQGGLWLAGWGDTSDRGMWVRFWIDEESERHPFASFNRRSADNPLGTMFMAVLVAMDDAGQPIDPTREHLAGAVEAPRKGRTASQWAHLIITGPKFCQWLREKEAEFTPKINERYGGWTPELARRYVVRHVLQSESLTVIDHDPEKLKIWHEKIRIPFNQWAGDE